MTEIKEGYTRVSSIVGQWNNFAHIPKHILENKCRIGRNVHEKIAADFNGIFLDLQADESPYYESWLAWRETHELRRCFPESRMYCDKLKITGAIDLMEKIGNKFLVIDYKTSATVNIKTWSMQAAFYHYLAKENGFHPTDNVLFLNLKKDGSEAVEHRISITDELWATCESALRCYRYFNG